MAQTTYTNPQRELLTGLDNVIIPKFIAGINGGRTLDASSWADNVIPAGVAIITDGNGAYKPMPVTAAVPAADAVYAKTTDVALDNSKNYYTKSGDAYIKVVSPDVNDIKGYYEQTSPATEAVPASYGQLPNNWAYAGILACSVFKSRPAASIMTAGQVNEIAAKPSLAAIKAAIKAALPGIEFVKDENSAAE